MKKITAGLDVSKYSCLSQEVLHEGTTPMALNLSVRKNLGVKKVSLLFLTSAFYDGNGYRVLAALTRKFTLDKNVSLVGIARRCPVNFTGADMYALCADAWLQATKRKVWFPCSLHIL